MEAVRLPIDGACPGTVVRINLISHNHWWMFLTGHFRPRPGRARCSSTRSAGPCHRCRSPVCAAVSVAEGSVLTENPAIAPRVCFSLRRPSRLANTTLSGSCKQPLQAAYRRSLLAIGKLPLSLRSQLDKSYSIQTNKVVFIRLFRRNYVRHPTGSPT